MSYNTYLAELRDARYTARTDYRDEIKILLEHLAAGDQTLALNWVWEMGDDEMSRAVETIIKRTKPVTKSTGRKKK